MSSKISSFFKGKKSLLNNILHIHRVSVIWSSDIWSFWLYFGYMVNGQSDFNNKFFGYMIISAIRSTLSWQNRGPYIRNPVYFKGRLHHKRYMTNQVKHTRSLAVICSLGSCEAYSPLLPSSTMILSWANG